MNIQSLPATRPLPNITRVLHLYLWFVMSLLLIQGTGSLILRLRPDIDAALPWVLSTLMNGNIPHAILHIAWGTFGLFVLAVLRQDRVRLALAWIFGVFYSLLGVLGFIILNPFGMRLAWQENVFHLTIGPVMVALVYLATVEKQRLAKRG